MTIRALTLLALASASSPVAAEGFFNFEPAKGGVYVSGFGGGDFRPDSFFTGVSDPVPGVPGPTGVAGVPITVNLDYETGYQAGGAIGAQLPFKYWSVFHPRVEVEVSYARLGVNEGSFNGGNQIFDGNQSNLYVFLNNYSDIRWSEKQRFIPYVGGGAGVAFVRSDVGYFPASATPGATFAVTGRDTAFATHAAIGVSSPLSRGAEAFVEGRYTRTYSASLKRSFVGGGGDLFVADISDGLNELTAMAGLRWRF